MGIYIEGMAMPTNCHECRLVDVLPTCPCRQMEDEDFWRDVSLSVEGHKNCPLVPVPPHGSLIEKNAVFEMIRSFPNVDCQLPVEFMKALYELPTIIPADKEEI